MTNYRCREHLDKPVNWRGRGCEACASRDAKRDQERAEERQRQREQEAR